MEQLAELRHRADLTCMCDKPSIERVCQSERNRGRLYVTCAERNRKTKCAYFEWLGLDGFPDRGVFCTDVKCDCGKSARQISNGRLVCHKTYSAEHERRCKFSDIKHRDENTSREVSTPSEKKRKRSSVEVQEEILETLCEIAKNIELLVAKMNTKVESDVCSTNL